MKVVHGSRELPVVRGHHDLDAIVEQGTDHLARKAPTMFVVACRDRVVEYDEAKPAAGCAGEEDRQPEGVELRVAEHTSRIPLETAGPHFRLEHGLQIDEAVPFTPAAERRESDGLVHAQQRPPAFNVRGESCEVRIEHALARHVDLAQRRRTVLCEHIRDELRFVLPVDRGEHVDELNKQVPPGSIRASRLRLRELGARVCGCSEELRCRRIE
jgi:hypothetical protein